MLHAGLKLYNRINGAAGSLGHLSNTSSSRTTGSRSNQFANQFDGSKEFRSALRNLNLVMATCTLCLTIQVAADLALD
jgi:hypothetical protein